MARKRLIWQLLPLLLVVSGVSVAAACIAATISIRQLYRDETYATLQSRAELARKLVEDESFTSRSISLTTRCDEISQLAHARVTFIAPDGIVLADSERRANELENHAKRPEIAEALAGRPGESDRFSTSMYEEMCYVALPVKRGDDVVGVIRLSVATPPLRDLVLGFYRNVAVAVIALLVVVWALSHRAARRLVQPIEIIRRGAERFARGDLGSRLRAIETEEMGKLAGAMNEMATHLQERFRAVENQRNELEAVLASMVEGVIAVDSSERILSLNAAASELLHLARQQAIGRSLHEVVRNTELQRLVETTLRGQEPLSREITFGHGAERHVHAHGAPLGDAQGRNIGALIVLHDVTELRRLENARRDFVANVSHELKTPITSIKGYVETLLDGALDDTDDARRFLAIVGKQADRLNAVIEDLLTLSRIEQGAETDEMPRELSSVGQVADAAIRVCENNPSARALRVHFEQDADTAARINPALLQLAIENLVDNAIKYSEPNGAISVEVRRGSESVNIHVHDKGCGIEPEHLSRIFERFYRVDKARSRKRGGTGLGLAIVKHIVRLHGGETLVESVPRQGSTFSIILPATTASRSVESTKDSKPTDAGAM